MASCTEESEATGRPSGEQEAILHGVHTHTFVRAGRLGGRCEGAGGYAGH